MKKAFVLLITVALLGMLAAVAVPDSSTNKSPSADSATSTTPTSSTNSSQSTPSTPTTSTTYKDGTYQGDTSSNQFEDIQVTVSIKDDKISQVTHRVTSDDRKSDQINSYALPQLEQATTDQQAIPDGISGATCTSQSYSESLQSALDKAKSS